MTDRTVLVTVNPRPAFIASQRQADRDMRATLRATSEQLTGAVMQASRDGQLPTDASLRTRLGEIVEAAFVQRRNVYGEQQRLEVARQEQLIQQARQAYKEASQASKPRIAGRIQMLQQRLELAKQGVVVSGFDQQGRPATPVARALKDNATTAVQAGVDKQASALGKLLPDDDASKLAANRTGDNIKDIRRQSLMGWQDNRGYTVQDRLWAAGEDAKARTIKHLVEAVTVGASAAALIDTLTRAVTGRSLTNIFMAGIRLVRAEITRVFGVTMKVGAQSMPAIIKVHWHLSPNHDPKNCDGSCDDFAAQDEAQGGFDPDSAPEPIVDTHNYCQCSTSQEIIQVTDPDYGALTPLASQSFADAVIGDNE